MDSRTPSGASKRLLTMGFMQRAAAAASPTTPNTPASDDGHHSKRRKTNQGSSAVNKPDTSKYVVDLKATQAALDEEERRRQVLVKKQAEQLGDAHWELDPSLLPKHKVEGLRVVQVGFSQLDAADSSEDEESGHRAARPALQSYGPQKAMVNKTTDESDADSDSNSDSGSDSDDSDDSDSSDSSSEESDADHSSQRNTGRASYGPQKRNELRAKRKAEQDKARKVAMERRKKNVQLNKLTSISGASSFNSKGHNGPGKGPPPPRRR